MKWWRNNWLFVVAFICALIFSYAFACFTAKAQTPVEPPSQWTVPRDRLRQAFPDSVLTPDQLEILIGVFQDVAYQMYSGGRYTYEAIRNPLIQDTIGYLSAADSVFIVWPKPFRDTNYSACFTFFRYRNGVKGIYTGTGFSIRHLWPESCYVKTNGTDDSGYVMAVGIGLRK